VNEAKAIRSYRRALLIALIAPVFEYVRFILFSGSILYAGVVIVFAFIFAVSVPALWFLGFRVIMFVSAVFHFVFGGTTTRAEWQQATFSGLWPLPYGCALGVVIWLSYSLGSFGGWPSDVVFGTLANLVGAWLYLTIFWRWFVLRRSSTPHLHATPSNA
jgi:hypothetical protein